MVTASIHDDSLVLRVQGADKMWALKSELSIPLANITSVYVSPNAFDDVPRGVRVLGSAVPNVVRAGTFYTHDGKVFWDVHDPTKAIVIELTDENYDALVVEVADPEEVTKMIWSRINE